ncbi:MAG TPA: cbb3-type cytochrome c oxidase subunit I [Pirellulaceae bacterium]|nr:cbb3-type cytochrome c oxidase subunit I [Pirellulaceae bacterium]HMO91364.1 cbb3-type cytochrome c oxidase subunit I [Pirellulaceae bacterium]HMP70244.1 cbb3-type cytochrome c oxidase subunit I [Pirellulaceae bacterium]
MNVSYDNSIEHENRPKGLLRRYVFSRDHKVIGIQFLFSTLLWMVLGGLLALGIRWQLAWPWSDMPIVGSWLFAEQGGQITPEFYTVLFTMHGTIMIFFVVIPILSGAFGNYLIPLMIGARDMAFPTLNMLSYWLMWPAFALMVLAFLAPGHGPAAGWTAYPPLSVIYEAAPGSHGAQTLWLLSLLLVGISSMLGAINYITTIFQMRAPGLTLFRMPMTIWTLLVTAILQAFTLPVLTVALVMQLADRLVGTSFFIPVSIAVNSNDYSGAWGQPLLWQHLFWFYSHPAVYIMILPAMGMVSDIICCFARKPLFGYRPMVYSVMAIAVLSFVVWGHHMFVSGMSPYLGMAFMISTTLIALPSGVKVFNWLATLWGGQIHFTTSMLFCISFIVMFVIGGLSGVMLASSSVDEHLHDTHYIVAHFHYVLFAGTIMAVFGCIYFWFPKMFGRHMHELLGKVHFVLTFVSLNCTFFPMHLLGHSGFLRRTADPYGEAFAHLQPLNQFITYSALVMGAVQVLFLINFVFSLCWGRRATENPWRACTLEWMTSSPPPHGNFVAIPNVICGPHEYSDPECEHDFRPQGVVA